MISLGVIKRLSLRLQVFGKNPSTPASIEIRDFVYGSQYGFPVNMTWVNSERVDFHTSFMISFSVVCHKFGTVYQIFLLFSVNHCGQTVEDIAMGPTATQNFIFLLCLLIFSNFQFYWKYFKLFAKGKKFMLRRNPCLKYFRLLLKN